MEEITLPVGVQADIDEAFCYREDKSYQDRAHEYLERYEVARGYRDTAVQAVVTDLAKRAFLAGAEGCEKFDTEEELGEIQAELLETAAKCTRAAIIVGGGSLMTSPTSDRVCMLELNTDMTRIVCSKCGWEVPAGTNPNTVRECGGCERVVVYGDTPRLYLIGPVTGKPNDNRETFRAVRAILRKDGYECDCPHHYIEAGTEWGSAMRISIRQMLANDGQSTIPMYDGIAMLDGWEQSRGAKIEHDIAEALDMPCRPWREWLSPAAPAAQMADAPACQPLLALAC